jgi:crotonobetainyl-CoA:carnitine CoA-transferase CaiB-like acyl-CoA transferase
MANTVLDGCRVLELADEKALFCGKLLAELGAEVIRIEKPGEKSGQTAANAGKRCIYLDIENKEGRELFFRLIGISDIVVEGFSPGYLEKLGMDYKTLSAANPRLIMASITHFGQTGPYRDYRSSALVSSALGGQVFVCGDSDRAPLKPFGPQAYYTACLFAAIGIMLALNQRHTSQKGQYVDISVHECTAAALDHQLVRYFYQGIAAQRNGSLYWNDSYRVFPCKDGFILLSLMHQWDTLVEWLAAEGMAEDLARDEWRDEEMRHRNIAHIIHVLEKWTLCHNVAELVETGQLMRFPWAGVASISGVVENPQLNARGFFIDALDPATGRHYKYPGAPFIMSRSPLRINPEVPAAGEYTAELLQKEMGISSSELEDLARRGVI